jgi:hypothetical protein
MPFNQHLLTLLKLLPTVTFTRYLLTLLKLTAVAGVALICACILNVMVFLAVSPAYRVSTLRLFGFYTLANDLQPRYPETRNLSIEDRDLLSVLPDHTSISRRVQYCIGINIGDSLPWQVSKIFLTQAQMLRISGVGQFHPIDDEEKWPDNIRRPNRHEEALLQLSKNLSEQRVELIGKVRSAYFFLKMSSLVSIMIGMITTILVSVSSTEFGRGDGPRQKLIRVFAIIFPALGTAAAAVTSFYSPQAEWGQASRTLASVAQLHGQMALAVWKLPCTTTDTDDTSATPLMTALDDWSKRYTDIQTISNASGAPGGGNQGGGNQGGGNQGGGNQGGGNQGGGNQGGGNQGGGNQGGGNQGGGRQSGAAVSGPTPQ